MKRLLLTASAVIALNSCSTTVDFSAENYNESELQWAENLSQWYPSWEAPALVSLDDSPAENPAEPEILFEGIPQAPEAPEAEVEKSSIPADSMGISLVGGSYTVAKGDTLSSIARKHATSISAILNANPGMKKSSPLKIGQMITLP